MKNINALFACLVLVSCNASGGDSKLTKLAEEMFLKRHPSDGPAFKVSQRKFTECYLEKFKDYSDFENGNGNKEELMKRRSEAFNQCTDRIEGANEQEKFDYFGMGYMEFANRFAAETKRDLDMTAVANQAKRTYESFMLGSPTRHTKHSSYFMGCAHASTQVRSIDEQSKQLGEKYHPAKSKDWCKYDTI